MVRHAGDYSRVQEWHVAKCAKFFCQTAIVSRYQDPRLVAILDRRLRNVTGRVQVQQVSASR